MAEVTMPRLSDTMEEGKLLRWLKQAGEPVEAGEILAEVETDKADMELEATSSGVLREVRLAEGESAPVGAVIAVIDDGGNGGGAAATQPAAPRRAAREAQPERTAVPATPPAEDGKPTPATRERRAAPAPAREVAPAPETPAATPPRPTSIAAAPGRPAAAPRAHEGSRVSPLAQSLARELGVDATRLRGTGPGGRVTRADVDAAHRAREAGGAEAASAPARASAATGPVERPAQRAPEAPGEEGGEGTAAPAPPAAQTRAARPAQPAPAARSPGIVRVRPAAEERAAGRARGATESAVRVQRVPLTRMRASIARRMAESKREAPHFYLTATVDMEQAVRLRASLREAIGEDVGVTFNHMVLKACADALAAVPEVNSRFAGDAVELALEVNLGVAIAVEEGLIVPVIHGADELSLFDIAARARELGERARTNSFSGNDLSGATFSVSNLGMYGIDAFAAVINPPQAGILAVGSVEPRPVVRDGALAVAHTMSATLSCDHRAVDGARGAKFLAEVKRRLENPVSLLVAAPRG